MSVINEWIVILLYIKYTVYRICIFMVQNMWHTIYILFNIYSRWYNTDKVLDNILWSSRIRDIVKVYYLATIEIYHITTVKVYHLVTVEVYHLVVV
jgi:hypothetical protein